MLDCPYWTIVFFQLSRIERLEEKLRAMSHMSHFSGRITKLNEVNCERSLGQLVFIPTFLKGRKIFELWPRYSHNVVAVTSFLWILKMDGFVLTFTKTDSQKSATQFSASSNSAWTGIKRNFQHINDLVSAAKLMQNSTELHGIVQLLLTYGNFISGDFNAQLVKGFRTSCLLDVSLFRKRCRNKGHIVSKKKKS